MTWTPQLALVAAFIKQFMPGGYVAAGYVAQGYVAPASNIHHIEAWISESVAIATWS